MYKIFAPFILLSTFSTVAIEINSDSIDSKIRNIQQNADKLGLSMEQFYKLSSHINQSRDGNLAVKPEIPLLSEPTVLNVMEYGSRGEKVPQWLFKEYQQLLLYRTEQLSVQLGLPTGAFVLQQSFIAEELKSSISTSDEEEIEIIVVTAKEIQQFGGSGIGTSLAVYSIATRSGIRQYKSFLVVFADSNTRQTWKYNNFSGGWPDGPLITCSAGGVCAPSPND